MTAIALSAVCALAYIAGVATPIVAVIALYRHAQRQEGSDG